MIFQTQETLVRPTTLTWLAVASILVAMLVVGLLLRTTLRLGDAQQEVTEVEVSESQERSRSQRSSLR